MLIDSIKAKILLKCQVERSIKDLFRELDYNNSIVGLRNIVSELLALGLLEISRKEGRVNYYIINRRYRDKILEIAKEIIKDNDIKVIDRKEIFKNE